MSSHVVQYKIICDSSFCDNHLVTFPIDLSDTPLGGSSWKVNAKFLQEAKDPIKVL